MQRDITAQKIVRERSKELRKKMTSRELAIIRLMVRGDSLKEFSKALSKQQDG